MHYQITKQTYRGAVRWQIAEGNCVLGYYPTRKQALVTARLLAGHSGSVTIVKTQRDAYGKACGILSPGCIPE